MAGEWIKMELSTPDKPEVLRLARILGIDKDAVLGKLFRVWAWFDKNTVDGHVDGVVSTDVDGVVMQVGFTSAMQQVGWFEFDDDAQWVRLVNFDRHNGETAKNRALKNKRQSKWRANVDAQPSTETSTDASTREEKRREEKAVLLAAAGVEAEARRFDAAAALAERAVSVASQSPHSCRALLDVRLGAGDWAAAEQAGRALLALRPDDPAGARGVAHALLRQDRAREAIELLTAFLSQHEDASTRAFLSRLQHDQKSERGLEEQKLAHFHVRYDGDAHEDVGREILRLLERHYATLARIFDYQPTQPVPVILLSRESYYDATGAPAWSGGQYDSFDGRVRVPIGGLSAALSPELDGTLIHELTHSFVADLSRGLAPRELHEGLAQYMEGRRLSQLDAERLRALADGRLAACRLRHSP